MPIVNKFASATSYLSALGSLLSGLLVFLHYYPDLSQAGLCSQIFLGNCHAVNQSEYATLLGFPIAAYGLLFYLVIWCTTLLADYAQALYELVSFTFLFPLIALSLVVDLALVLVLLKIQLFCFLCFLTYGINLALFLMVLFWLKSLLKQNGISIVSFKVFVSSRWQSLGTAALFLYVLLVAFLGFALFSATYILKMKTVSPRLSQAQIENMLQHFYSKKVEPIDIPASDLTMGSPNARVRLIAFTDFLCPPCQRLFEIDRKLRSEFKNELSIAYYNYPLDSACNPYVNETSHSFSCVASKAVIAAAELNVFESYLNKFFQVSNESSGNFSKETAMKISDGLSDALDFARKMDFPATDVALRRDIGLANKLHIRATPTLFLKGRRIEGVPPLEFMEAAIRRELGY
jgi:protein-disulfide isomerase/uncharacterized membrane protein